MGREYPFEIKDAAFEAMAFLAIESRLVLVYVKLFKVLRGLCFVVGRGIKNLRGAGCFTIIDSDGVHPFLKGDHGSEATTFSFDDPFAGFSLYPFDLDLLSIFVSLTGEKEFVYGDPGVVGGRYYL